MVCSAPVSNQSKLTRLFHTDLRFSTFNQNSSNKEMTTYNWLISTCVCHPCELLVNCEFAPRGSDSLRSSEPKETNACNKWSVYQHLPSFVCSLDTYFLFSVWQWKCQDRYLFRHPLSNQTIWITKGIWQCGKNLSMLYWFINITAPLFWGLVTDDCKSKSHVTNSVQLAYKHFLPYFYL